MQKATSRWEVLAATFWRYFLAPLLAFTAVGVCTLIVIILVGVAWDTYDETERAAEMQTAIYQSYLPSTRMQEMYGEIVNDGFISGYEYHQFYQELNRQRAKYIRHQLQANPAPVVPGPAKPLEDKDEPPAEEKPVDPAASDEPNELDEQVLPGPVARPTTWGV